MDKYRYTGHAGNIIELMTPGIPHHFKFYDLFLVFAYTHDAILISKTESDFHSMFKLC